MHGRICLLILALLVGCSDAPTSPPPSSPDATDLPTKTFDAANTGTIRGVVYWDGDIPIPSEQTVRAHATNPYLYRNPAKFKLPHYPKVAEATRGIEHAVVYLRMADAPNAKPWDHPAVRVEIHDRQLHVVQGDRRSGVGFVRHGGVIDIVNRDTEYHNLVGRGVAFFANPLIEKDRVRKQTLSKAGIVDLSSGNGYYWLHAHLFVADHPYFTCTDRDGRFTLEQVPPGKYELVCWLPSWQTLRKERDPETGTVTRLLWSPPVEQARSIDVRVGESSNAEYRWTTAAFQ